MLKKIKTKLIIVKINKIMNFLEFIEKNFYSLNLEDKKLIHEAIDNLYYYIDFCMDNVMCFDSNFNIILNNEDKKKERY